MITPNKDLIIAVDGYSSCGKSTLAKSLARELQYIYIDSGAMYRAVTYFALRNGIIWDGDVDSEKLLANIANIHIHFQLNNETQKNETILNGENVEEVIRSIAVSDNVSNVSKIAQVRRQMVYLQREMGKNRKIVMDGRDIGTVVFPDADLKLFMTASPDVRALRRFEEYQLLGDDVTFDAVKENIKLRDYIDENRDESPLRKAADAVIIDNSNYTKEEQLNLVLDIIKEKFC